MRLLDSRDSRGLRWYLPIALVLSQASEPRAQGGSPLVVSRNGNAVNPPCLGSLTPPLVGELWRLEVDTLGHPGVQTTLLESRMLPSTGPRLLIGELLIDRTSLRYFSSSAGVSSHSSVHSVAIPPNPALLGLTLSVQAGIGQPVLTLCNALDATVGTLTTPTAQFSASTARGLGPLSVDFDDLSVGPYTSWLWDFGDADSSTDPSPTHVYSAPGSYTVSLTVSGPMGQSVETKTDLVEVLATLPDHDVLVILLDDASVADIPAYGLNPNLPVGLTPNIDALVAQGVLFETAWASPFCSPTRSMLLTGRHAFRTGIGNVIEKGPRSLRLGELTLPEAIQSHSPATYATGAFGKWQLEATQSNVFCPTDRHGFDFFAGTLFAVQTACNWTGLQCPGGSAPSLKYLPEVIMDAANSWVGAQSDPWLCYLAPQSPYQLLQTAPSYLQSLTTGPPCVPCAPTDRTCYLAELQAFDTKLGELLATLGPNWPEEVTVVFTADNGTPNNANDYWLPGHALGSLYEGGVHVPLVISGRAVDPLLRGTRSTELASVVDIYRTVAPLTGAVLPAGVADDSVDLRPALSSPPTSPGRTLLFTERFDKNTAVPPYPQHEAAIRGQRFKLIYDKSSDADIEFYDLLTDPLEATNLLLPSPPPAGTTEGDALIQLRDAVQAMLASA